MESNSRISAVQEGDFNVIETLINAFPILGSLPPYRKQIHMHNHESRKLARALWTTSNFPDACNARLDAFS